jgi:L-lactate dehydrogenase complex protein LldG
LFSSVQAEGRSHAIAPDTQIVIAFKNQLLYNVGQALSAHTEKYSELPSMISLTSGASRTADIEKTLVMGAHGPKELIVIMLDLD